MQTKHLFLLPALAFLACASLQAQVTIGGLTEPKPGTILDLNSDVKGGLILSNVGIENLSEIPTTFPGANGAEPIALKTGLIGSVIYNTNPVFCTGVHVWNGNFWERVASGTPEPASGTTLSITSGSNNSLGGDVIGFTAAPGAKIYRWYASLNDAPYEYIGLTTTETFSKTFPAGNNKVKVVMDDCQSLKESNEVTFAPDALSPISGSVAGENIIYIYGDFPYAATSEYESDGLVAHFDGINNQGLGDKQHSLNADKWVDLKSGFELLRGDGPGEWLSNGFRVLDDDTAFYASSFPTTFPAGTDPRTIEVIFRTPAPPMFTQQVDVQRLIFGYGEVSDTHWFGIQYRGRQGSYWGKPEGCSPENRWIFYAIYGYSNNLVTCLSSTPSLETPSTINTVTSTYANSIQDADSTNSYINNVPAEVLLRVGNALNTTQGPLIIGEYLSGSTFLSARLYNRVLKPEEIATNAALDQKRYLTPPTVTIGDASCTEVVVLSPHFLMCKVPPSSTTGTRDVVVNGNIIYSGAYTYVDASEFFVSSISPIVGSEGTELTLTGNQLNTITEIKAGNNVCTELSTNTTSCSCKIPFSNSTGEVDITITAGDKTYRFAKVFEYQ